MLGKGLPLVAACVMVAVAAQPAAAAKSCDEPDRDYQRATPAEAGMDAGKLQAAVDYGTSQLGFSVRVYRHGCLVAEDRLAPLNRDQTGESYSMAKSLVSLMFGAAMQDGFVSPDDPVGSLYPGADQGDGIITMRNLLEMSSGLHWNGARDYNVFTPFDRVRDALTLDTDHPPGTYFEYAQSPVTLLANLIGRSTGLDPQEYMQREVMDPLDIPRDGWSWSRDGGGNTYGFWGVELRADDYAKLGDLLRRGGVWKGKRILSEDYMREALSPSANNHCYGWLIWVNNGDGCVSPTLTDRPEKHGERRFPGLPADNYTFSGLFGQLVSVFPTQDIEVVRLGQDPGLVFSGGEDWETSLYRRVLGSITDGPSGITKEPPGSKGPNADYGFQTAFQHPSDYDEPFNPTPLGPAGPQRARAAQLTLALPKPSRKGNVAVRLRCPPVWPGRTDSPHCQGVSWVETSRGGGKRYDVAAGGSTVLKFKMTKRRLGQLKRDGSGLVEFVATNDDALAGTQSKTRLLVQNAGAKKKKRRHRR